jgi:GNAT superfamily N-acetyltransferase
MTESVSYRLITPDDGPALEALIVACPDAGTIGFTYDYRADLYEINRTLATDFRGVVAVANEAVIGMMFGEVLQVQWAGELQRGVYVSNLRVHPDFRRRGVARGLSDWGMAYVIKHLGPDTVVYSAIQRDNVTLSLARQYQLHATPLIQGSTIPMRRRPPKPRPQFAVRLATTSDLPTVAEGMNQHYRAHNLWSPVTSVSLQEFLDQQVAGVRPNQLYVVTRGDRILGGLSLSDRTSLVRMRVAHAPGYVQLLGRWLGVLPQDGVLRALTVRRVWFVEGELEAGRYLWQQLRYRLRDQGNCMGIAYDPRDKLADLFQAPFWLPMVKAHYLVRATGSLEPERFTYCVAGA